MWIKKRSHTKSSLYESVVYQSQVYSAQDINHHVPVPTSLCHLINNLNVAVYQIWCPVHAIKFEYWRKYVTKARSSTALLQNNVKLHLQAGVDYVQPQRCAQRETGHWYKRHNQVIASTDLRQRNVQ